MMRVGEIEKPPRPQWLERLCDIFCRWCSVMKPFVPLIDTVGPVCAGPWLEIYAVMLVLPGGSLS